MTADTAKRDTGAFSISIVVGLVVVGVLSFAAFIVLSAFADDLRRPDDGGAHALSKSAVGYAGIVSLLQAEGRTVRVSRGPLDELTQGGEVVVLTPPVGEPLKRADVNKVWGDLLIVLPKWSTRPGFENPEWVRSGGVHNITRIRRILAELGLDVTVERGLGAGEVTLLDYDRARAAVPSGRIDRLQTVSGEDVSPILATPEGKAVLAQIGNDDDGRLVYILSDPDLLNTQGIASATTARASLLVFDRVAPRGAPLVFDMTLHGMERSRNFLKLLFEPPFLPAVLCLVFAAGLIAVSAFAGTLRKRAGREIALGKTMLVENSALLVSLAGRDQDMGRRYVAMTRSVAANAAGVPSRSTEAQQTTMLDAATRHSDQPNFSMLATETTSATTPAALLRAVNRLYRWRQEIGREHRRR